jgi:hypothetical protein
MGKATNFDLTLHRFGRWVVLARTGRNRFWHKLWLCRCDCGREKSVTESALLRGISRSCGCLRNEVTAIARTEARSRRAALKSFAAA